MVISLYGLVVACLLICCLLGAWWFRRLCVCLNLLLLVVFGCGFGAQDLLVLSVGVYRLVV